MRLYGAIQKVEAQDDGTVRVYGIATSEAVDDQGEIVRADAMRAAIPEYMRFPALREMHQLSAAGTTLEAEVCDDATTRIVAHVVDPIAVAKVKNGVYRGFSIGGRVLQREPGNPKTITGLLLNEISLVDRPANPEAVFDCWKAALEANARLTQALGPGPETNSMPSMQEAELRAPFNPPIQIWACGVTDHCHFAKVDAVKCIEKQAHGSDPGGAVADPNRERADITRSSSSEPSELCGDVRCADPGFQADKKKRYPIDTIAHIRAAWNYINKPANAEKYTTGQLERIKAAIVAAWQEKIDKDGPPSARETEKRAGVSLAKTRADVDRIAGMVSDLEWLGQALGVDTMVENDENEPSSRALEIVAELCEFLNALLPLGTGDAGSEPEAPTLASPAASGGGGVRGSTRDARDVVAQAARRAALQASAQADASAGKAVATQELAKALAVERAENLALGQVLTEIVPMLERLTERVEAIARTPLPPLTIAKGTVSVSKQQDRGSIDRDPVLSREAIASALAKMSKEEQTLMLIKASYANPIRTGAGE